MNVICVKPTKKLIKNKVYKVAKLSNFNKSNSRYFNPSVMIYISDSLFLYFPLSTFKPTEGDSFPQIEWISPDYQAFLDEKQQTKIDGSIKAGDYVVPMSDGLKTLISGRKYKIKEVFKKEHGSVGRTGWVEIKIKLEGSERWYMTRNFRKCSDQEQREIALNDIFEVNNDIQKVIRKGRKIEHYNDEEKKVLFSKLLIQSANDRFRNDLDIIEWAIQKTGERFSLKNEDFDLIRNLSLSEFLELIK